MDDRPLCLLALDGGGIRGLSELVVLEQIMDRIKYDLKADGDLLPADFFDLIGGTSTGGLIALLLGRLRLSVPQARKEYVRIAEEVFSLPRYLQKNAFDGGKLEAAVKRLLGDDRSEERMLDRDGSCKVFVCAVPQQDVKARSGPRLFRTYRVRENASFNCTIWEACRATSAAPSYFEPIKIGDDGEQETFVDGGLGYNNPVEQVLEEARRIFPGRKVACIVSLGTGIASAIAFPDSPKTSWRRLIDALKKMATESDTTAEKMHGRFQNVRDAYFRFSVDRGLQDIGLEEWKELPNVRTFTTEYLHQHVVSEQVNKVVIALLASKCVGQEGSNKQIRLSGGSSGAEGPHSSLPQTLGWQPKEGSIPAFRYTTEQLASHIIVPLSQPYFLVPFGRNKDFVGRESTLAQLLKRIPPSADKDDCQRTAIEGLGGVGKTQIALEAAFRVRDEHPDCHVFWVPAVDAATFENSYREIGRQLQIAGIDDDQADVKLLVKTALSQSADNWLLIIDNADDVELLFGAAGATPLCDCLPFNYRGSILFTTRNHEAIVKLDIPQRGILNLAEMSRPEAVDLLQRNIAVHQLSDTQSTTSLLNFLADLPLAIKQASAYMAKTGITTARYLNYCQSGDERLIELLSKDFEDRTRYKSTRYPVAATWLISFRHISRGNQLAAQYLRFMSFLAEKDIPKSLLPPGNSDLEADEAIGTLKAYAFITERPGQESYDVHRLVRLAMRNWLAKEGELKACATTLIQHLDKVFPFPKHENWAVCVRYLPHALTALGFRDHSTDDTAKSSLLFNVAESTFIVGKYEEAEALCRQSLKLRTRVFGAEHPNTLASMHGVADLLHSQGKYEEAEALHQQTLKLRTRVLGAKHPNTLTSINNLANSLRSQGKYEEAEALHRQTLKLRTQLLGAEHPDTLDSIRGVANSLHCQGKYKEAEALYRQTLKLRTRVLGAEHPDTLVSMNNLANSLRSQGKYEEAEALHRQSLKLRTRVLGAEHPDTLVSMLGVAISLHSQGKYEEAEALYRQTLKLQTRVLGAEHPDTLFSMLSVANSLYSQGKYEEAEALYRQTLKLRTRVFGAEHPYTLDSMLGVANSLHCQGKYEEAEALHQQTLKLRTRVLGAEHPDTLTSMNNLANSLRSQGKYEEAEALHQQTLQLRTLVLGAEHPDTLVSMNNLANSLYSQGKYEEAEALHRQSLKLRTRVLGAEHPDTLVSMLGVAISLHSQGKYEEAEALHQQTLKLRTRVLGAEHPDTLTSMNNLANSLRSQGKYEEAEALHQKTLQLRTRVLGAEHPDTLVSMNNLANSLHSQGKYEEAEALQQQTLKLRTRVLGAEHPDTLTSMNNLAISLRSQGKYEEAEAIFLHHH